MSTPIPLIIVGGGASGMAAAITAASILPPGSVTVLERGARVGRKLLATGNGRCNLTNRFAAQERYHGGDPAFVQDAFKRYPVKSNLDFFYKMGLMTVEEEEGKIYPRSLQAAAVLDILRLEMERLGVDVRTEAEVWEVKKRGNGFLVSIFDLKEQRMQTLTAGKVILACGGEASAGLGGCDWGYRLLKQLGHPVTERLPGIVQLKTDGTATKGLSGSKFETIITLTDGKRPVRREQGELLFTDYGVSGPPVMQLSASAARLIQSGKRAQLLIDFAPDLESERIAGMLAGRRKARPDKRLEDFMTGFLPKRLGQCLLKAAGVQPLSRPAASLTEQELTETARLMKNFPLSVTGTNGMKNAQVTLGGAQTSGFDPATMESKRIPGLFVTGELYDIDGDCGGFNLQWAWSSGRLAGASAAAAVK